MAKWADYLISGIWISEVSNSKYISHVMLHKDTDTTFEHGVKTGKDDVIRLIKAGRTVVSIKWDYVKATWVKGAAVTYENRLGVDYLRTVKDATVTDNLDNLISMWSLA